MTKILLPVDGSELDSKTASFAAYMARSLNASVVVMSVINKPNPEGLAGGFHKCRDDLESLSHEAAHVQVKDSSESVGSNTPEYFTNPDIEDNGDDRESCEIPELQVRSSVRSIAEQLLEQGVHAAPLVTFGKPADEIVSASEELECELIIMATHGRGLLGRAILGSVTDQVIHSANVPVLALTPHKNHDDEREGVNIAGIMVLLDGTPMAERSLQYVEMLAGGLSIGVTLVRIINPMFSPFLDGSPADASREQDRLEAQASEYLQRIAARLDRSGIQTRFRVVVGDVPQIIVPLTKKTPDQMVALATHGRTGLVRWTLGSVTQALIRDAGAPVLVIPPRYLSQDK